MKKIISTLALVLLFFACSRVELAMNWANNYISDQIDHYFEMNSLQLQIFKKTLNEDVEKIRKIIFPQLTIELQKIQLDIDKINKFNSEKIISHKNELRKIFNIALRLLEPSAQRFVNQLNPSQIKSFKNEFDKKTKNFEFKVSDSKEAKEERSNKIKNHIESWIGTLDYKQRQDIQNFCNSNPYPFKEQVLNRNKLSLEFIESYPDKIKRKNFIYQLFHNYESMREPSYARAIDDNEQKYYELLVVILNSLNFEQRKYLSRILKDRIDQMSKISEKTKSKLY